MPKHVSLDVQGQVGVVTIDRPPVNALDTPTYGAIMETFRMIDDDANIRVAILRAEGSKAFIAGKDLKSSDSGSDEDTVDRRFRAVRESSWAVYDCRVPVIAAVNGPALGAGLGFASVCDVLVAAEEASFGLPEINVGTLGGAKYLSRLVPQMLVRYLHLTGERISARELQALGAVVRVVPGDSLMSTAMEIAEQIAAKSPAAVQLAKKSLNAIEYMDLKRGYETEQGFSRQLLGHPEAREAVAAFQEKRAPVFSPSGASSPGSN